MKTTKNTWIRFSATRRHRPCLAALTTSLCLSALGILAQGLNDPPVGVQEQTTARGACGDIPTKTVTQRGRYVALSGSGSLLNSVDGQTWRPVELPFRT